MEKTLIILVLKEIEASRGYKLQEEKKTGHFLILIYTHTHMHTYTCTHTHMHTYVHTRVHTCTLFTMITVSFYRGGNQSLWRIITCLGHRMNLGQI